MTAVIKPRELRETLEKDNPDPSLKRKEQRLSKDSRNTESSRVGSSDPKCEEMVYCIDPPFMI